MLFLSFAVPFMGRVLEFQTLSDFSPTYSYSGLKSDVFMQLIIRWINPTAKNNLVFTQPAKHGTIDNQYFKPAEQ